LEKFYDPLAKEFLISSFRDFTFGRRVKVECELAVEILGESGT